MGGERVPLNLGGHNATYHERKEDSDGTHLVAEARIEGDRSAPYD